MASHRHKRSRRWRALAGGAALLGVLWLAGAAAPWLTASRVTICPWRTLSGHACPFCGLTRAVACAMSGDVQSASAFHPLWPLAIVALCALSVLSFLDATRGTDYIGWLVRATESKTKLIVTVLIFLTLARW